MAKKFDDRQLPLALDSPQAPPSSSGSKSPSLQTEPLESRVAVVLSLERTLERIRSEEEKRLTAKILCTVDHIE